MSELEFLKIQNEHEKLKFSFQINYSHLVKLFDQILKDKSPVDAIGSQICDVHYNAIIDNKKYIEAMNSMKEILGPELCVLLLHGDHMGDVAYSKHSMYGDFGIKRCVFIQDRYSDSTRCKIKVSVVGIVFHKEVILDPEYKMKENAPIDTII